MENEVITCVVEEIIYSNEDNGYAVFEASYADGSDYFIAVGILPCISEGQYLNISGYWTNHYDYGDQFKVEYYDLVMPSDEETIMRYLSSGIVEGVREATAKKLVEEFGSETLDVMLSKPELMAKIKGISEEKANKISESFRKLQSVQNIIMFLQKYNISPSVAMKVYEIFGNKSIEIIEKNPYALSDSINGISFNMADMIGFNMGIPKNSIMRIKSGIKHIMQSAAYQSGHTYMPRSLIIEDCAYKLDVREEEAENALVILADDNDIIEDIIDGKRVCFLNEIYNEEFYIATRLAMMAKSKPKIVLSAKEAEQRINLTAYGIKLAPEQRDAIITAVSSECMVLTGGPGTGKTTTVNVMIEILESMGLRVELAAPTGRAAKRMSQLTGRKSKTIHRMLGTEYKNGIRCFTHDSQNPLMADVVILDEVSMIDTPLMTAFLKAVKIGARVIFCGDSDQLPSIGPGNVLKDIIDSGAVPVIKLSKIFRQAEQSMIIVNAHRINNGEVPDLKTIDNDFFFLHRNTSKSIQKTMIDLFLNRLPKSYNVNPLSEIQILSPTKKGDIGTISLNKTIQNVYNPPSPDKSEHKYGKMIFREGDKVMQIKNNYDLVYKKADNTEGTGVFNGDMGIIESIDTSNKYMTVLFDEDKFVDYPFSALDELELSYAVTVHKSQGSEFPIIIMPMGYFMPRLMTRNLFYTAVTRARDMVILVGSETTVKNMVANDFTKTRFTALNDRISFIYNMESDKNK